MILVSRSKLSGTLQIPPSKSHSLRALIFGGLAHGTSTISNLLDSPDIEAAKHALQKFGVRLEKNKITGPFRPLSNATIDAGNSGIVLRFLGAISGVYGTDITLTGDQSVTSNRPIMPLVTGLRELGASVFVTGEHAPITVSGTISSGTARLCGKDSQPVSGLAIACAMGCGPFTLHIDSPGEKPWIDMTFAWFDKLSIPYQREDYSLFTIPGNTHLSPFTYTVPGDMSSLAFPVIAALITKSSLTIQGIDPSNVQGDKAIFPVLEALGARLQWNDDTLTVLPSSLRGGIIDVNPFIDALPALAALGCYCTSPLTLHNAGIARKKESDRITAMCTELSKLGASVQQHEEGCTISSSSLTGGEVFSYNDHRVAMALACAAMGAKSPVRISHTTCIQKTYPTFAFDMKQVGATIQEDL